MIYQITSNTVTEHCVNPSPPTPSSKKEKNELDYNYIS